MMKILLANKFFFRKGGAETVMFQEREFLLGAGHSVIDFAMRDDRNVESPYSSYFTTHRDYDKGGGLADLGAAAAFIHSPEAVRKIGELIDATAPDLLHCHNIYHQLTPSIVLAAKKRGLPVLLTLHDYKVVCPAYARLRGGQPCSECLDGDFRQVLRNRCAKGSLLRSSLLYAEAVVQRWLGSYEQVDRFIAPSRFMSEAVQRRFGSNRVTVLYNGVDTKGIAASHRDDGYVLFLGRLSPEKGLPTLLEAHQGARGAWPLLIAGTGPSMGELQIRYPQARFAGHLEGEALTETIAAAALVAVPSEWYENCPMSVLEAMAHGKPVVASRIGGIPELVRDGTTGLLCDPGDRDQLAACIGRMMSDASLRRRMGQAAREHVEQSFSLAAHSSRLVQLYESALEGCNCNGRSG